MTRYRVFLIPALLATALAWTACEPPPEAGRAGSASLVDPSQSAEPAEPTEWLLDYEQALALASEQNKPILINFTGSDWCPPCMRLKREVFQDDAFERYANENLVLLELDFPRSVEQSAETVEQNRRLQQEYEIEGFPTLIVLDPSGEEQRRHVGYMSGGPASFIDWLEG